MSNAHALQSNIQKSYKFGSVIYKKLYFEQVTMRFLLILKNCDFLETIATYKKFFFNKGHVKFFFRNFGEK